MGTPKAFLHLKGKTFLQWAIGLLESAPCEQIVVVCPPGRQEAFKENLPGSVLVLENPLPDRGMLSSLAIGMGAAADEATHALVTLVDTPLIAPGTVARLLTQSHGRPDHVVVPTHNGEPGHPIVIPRALWSPMTHWQGPMGARGFLISNPSLVLHVDVPDAGVLRDFDTPEDLAADSIGQESPPH
jgi:CTP:molybdopterin cytidylyltransferase MocA